MISITIYTIAFIISYLFQNYGDKSYSGLILILCAIFLYLKDVYNKLEIVHLRGIFALGFVGGLAISLLKLSKLSQPFEVKTWICLYLVYPIFYIVFEFIDRKYSVKDENLIENVGIAVKKLYKTSNDTNAICGFIGLTSLALAGISLICFIIEACILGYIPLFTVNMPHAYSYFHVKGLHYITILYVLIPSTGTLYMLNKKKIDAIFVFSILFPIIMSLLLVSRSSLLFSFILAFVVFLIEKRKEPDFLIKINSKGNIFIYSVIILVSACVLVGLYVAVTVFRAHSKEYLLGIFEMKDENIPLFIAQPYTYIANNYENFNVLVRDLKKHSFGLKGLYPFLTFSGIKFFVPSLVQFPMYVNKAELTTTTIIYDAYYDFGVIGVVVFSAILGIISAFVMNIARKTDNIFVDLIYAQVFYYMAFSFFSCWFSLPQTYVFLAVSFVLIFLFKKFKKSFCHL